MFSALKQFSNFILDGFRRRDLLVAMVKRDINSRYLGSALGFFWAFLHPLLTIGVLVIVFQYGLKSGSAPRANVPFIAWLISGLIPWFFIAESLNSGTSAVFEYDYLVKKVAFRTSLLNLVKLFSALIIHLVFVCILFVILFFYKVPLSATAIQLPYYIFGALILLTGITWITASLAVFAKDVLHIVGASIGLLFWLTPLVWDAGGVSAKWRLVLSLNPLWYITDGFRDALVFDRWFWEGDGLERTIIFWAITSVVFFAGALLFKRLRPHFADVL